MTCVAVYRRGNDPGYVEHPHPSAPGCSVAFGAAAREWLRYIEVDRKRRASTVREYRQVVHGHLIPEFGEDTPLSELTPARIEEYRERLVAEGRLSPRTINRNLTRLNGIFRRAIRAHGLRANPAAHVDRQPIRASGDFRVLAPAELERLLEAAVSEQDRALFAVAGYAGLRMGEVVPSRGGTSTSSDEYFMCVEATYSGALSCRSQGVSAVFHSFRKRPHHSLRSASERFLLDQATGCSCAVTAASLTTRRSGVGSIRRSKLLGCRGCGSTTSVIASGRWPFRRSRCRTSRPTWDTPRSRRR